MIKSLITRIYSQALTKLARGCCTKCLSEERYTGGYVFNFYHHLCIRGNKPARLPEDRVFSPK